MGDMTGPTALAVSSPLYLATSTYLVDQAEVAASVPEHREWIVHLYRTGVMLASGPQSTGRGGVLIFRAADDDAARVLVEDDPLTRQGLAAYELISFRPTPMPHRSPGLDAFLSQPIESPRTSYAHSEGVSP